ncbi:MAG: KpsF/GutQ family sugar-phosphate isomerase [Planctomyces sp.]|nr:KpsF/GutQ family sugar-phosphate isomerase [Planctomyces sp.]
MSAAEQIIPHTQLDQLRDARDVIRREADALLEVSRGLDTRFCEAVDLLLATTGSVVVTGMGKAGLIGQKIAATLSSTGTRAHFLHPAEAMHGDLGTLHARDVVLAFSNSGETEELTRLLPSIRKIGSPIIAVTGAASSALAQSARVVICYGKLREAGPHGLAPTATTTAMLAIGDALALVTSRQRGFGPQHFAALHPAGSLGRQLTRVTDAMRPLSQVRTASCECTVREAFAAHVPAARRSGLVLLLDSAGCLRGVFTDSDLARLLERRRDGALDGPIESVMTRTPVTIPETATLAEAVELLSRRKVSEIPVVNGAGQPVGLIDITDLIGWTPAAAG